MKVISVSQLNFYIKSVIEESPNLSTVYVKGEISNFTKHYQSGHMYFSLKDEKSLVKCVMFSTSAKRVRFTPQNSQEVIIRGKVSVYEPSGQYQIYVQDMQPDGIGALSLAFEELKENLFKEGLFDEAHKKSLPMYPEKVGIITSPTGAAVQDMLRILGRRWGIAEVVFCPSTVQGEKAEPELVSALKKLDSQGLDVIIIGRGGGSVEDLWAFNSEKLAREIYACKTPIVSAVGHETDYTICDFVSDLRASTPSAAAELVVPDIFEEANKLNSLYGGLNYFMDEGIKKRQLMLDNLGDMNNLMSNFIATKNERLQNLSKRLILSADNKLQKSANTFVGLSEKLDALSPLKVLSRGYGILEKNEKVVKSIKDIDKDDEIKVKLADGQALLKVMEVKENG